MSNSIMKVTAYKTAPFFQEKKMQQNKQYLRRVTFVAIVAYRFAIRDENHMGIGRDLKCEVWFH